MKPEEFFCDSLGLLFFLLLFFFLYLPHHPTFQSGNKGADDSDPSASVKMILAEAASNKWHVNQRKNCFLSNAMMGCLSLHTSINRPIRNLLWLVGEAENIPCAKQLPYAQSHKQGTVEIGRFGLA